MTVSRPGLLGSYHSQLGKRQRHADVEQRGSSSSLLAMVQACGGAQVTYLTHLLLRLLLVVIAIILQACQDNQGP